MTSSVGISYRLEPLGLKDMIDSLRGRFFTLEEFPLLSGELHSQDVLRAAMNLPESEVRSFAINLKGKELEGLLLELRNPLGFDEIERVSEILIIRISPRILKLLTAVFQYYDTSVAVNRVFKTIANNMQESSDSSRELDFIRSFGTAEDKIGAFCKAIEERERDIDRCFSQFAINKQSPFARRVALAYLENASRDGMMNNLRWVVTTIENHEKEALKDLFINYISSLNLAEFHDGINLAILEKIGQPYTSPDWADYDVKLRNKFAQWCYLHQLKLHSIEYPRKFSILRKYFDQVRNSYEIKEESLMIIDFGDIIVADIADNPYSFFYDKSVFESEMADWQKSREMESAWAPESGDERPGLLLPAFLRMDKENLTARDFMIEEMEESCVRLSYEGVDILYIQEMLDIKIGLEPDLRRKQLAKLKRKHSTK